MFVPPLGDIENDFIMNLENNSCVGVWMISIVTVEKSLGEDHALTNDPAGVSLTECRHCLVWFILWNVEEVAAECFDSTPAFDLGMEFVGEGSDFLDLIHYHPRGTGFLEGGIAPCSTGTVQDRVHAILRPLVLWDVLVKLTPHRFHNGFEWGESLFIAPWNFLVPARESPDHELDRLVVDTYPLAARGWSESISEFFIDVLEIGVI